MDRFYKYSILRAVPDPRRGEIVNVGIAVFHDESVDVKLAPSLAKLVALDGSVDLEQFLDLPLAIGQWTARFDSVEDKFNALKHFGLVTLTDLGTFQTTDALTYDDHVQRLLKTLIIPRPRESAAVTAGNRITTALRQIFRGQDVLGRSIEDIGKHLVVPNFPIDPEENLYADFALRNGGMWVTETADFRAKSTGSLDKSRVASFAAITIDRAKKRFRRTHSFIVYAAKSDSEVMSQLNLMGDYADDLINLQSRKDLARYTQTILEAAGPNRQIPA